MPLFKRGRKQDEEDLQWLYRNLQDLDDAETSREGEEEAPDDSNGDDVGVGTEMESLPEPELTEPPPPEPVLGEPEPVLDETTPPEPALGETPPHTLPESIPEEPTASEPPPVEVPTPVSRESLLAQEDVTPTTNESYERRSRQMSGNRRENPPFANRGQQPSQSRPQRPESPPADATTTDTIVGPQSYFTGTFRSEKDLRIEGTLEGEIDCRGTVIVAKDATLSATVRARNIEIAGSVTGDVFIEERLHLRSSGEMRGQSHAASFIVEEGGYFEGEMKMGATDQEEWPTIGSSSTPEGLGFRSNQPSGPRSGLRPVPTDPAPAPSTAGGKTQGVVVTGASRVAPFDEPSTESL